MPSPSRSSDPEIRAHLDQRAIELLRSVRQRFRVYGSELGAREWAPFDVGEVADFVDCFEPMVEALVLAHRKVGYSEEQLRRAVFACMEKAVHTQTSDTSRGPEYNAKPDLPATYPWMPSTLFQKDEFTSALKSKITEIISTRSEPGADAVVKISGPADVALIPERDWLFVAVSNAVPAVHGRIDLPLQILKDHLTREFISPEIAWEELSGIPSDERYSSELRRWISNELAHLSQPPGDVEEPAIDALRNLLQSPDDKRRREGVKMVIDRILAPPEMKDYEAAKRNAQRFGQLGRPRMRAGENAFKLGNDQTIAVEPVPTNQSFVPPAIHYDPTFPPPDIMQEAYTFIKDALRAWGFKGPEPEHVFWIAWLKQCGWRGQPNFMTASIEHCKVFAGHLLGEGREQDAAVFARAAVELGALQARADARISDLLAQQVRVSSPGRGDEKPDELSTSPRSTKTGHDSTGSMESDNAGGRVLPARLFRKTGEFWTLRFSGEEQPVSVKHRLGMEYIAQLLRSANGAIRCRELQSMMGSISSPSPSTDEEQRSGLSTEGYRDEILDEKAKREYGKRLKEIEAELDKATRNQDRARIENLNEEQQAILDELRAAVNVRGRSRYFKTPDERARKAVSAAIASALQSIEKHHATLGEHLRSRIELGASCRYNSDGIAWDL